jgi:hypothetical protein
LEEEEALRKHLSPLAMIPAAFFLALGVILWFVNISDTGLRLSLAGLFTGIGAGAIVTEVSAAEDRRELRKRIRTLQEPIFTEARNAFSLGDHFFGFLNNDVKSVREFKDVAANLGVSDAEVTKIQGLQYDSALRELEGRLSRKPQFYIPFFRLGVYLFAWRSSFAQMNYAPDELKIVGGKLLQSFEEVEDWCPTKYVPMLGKNVVESRLSGKLDDSGASKFLELIWVYFLALNLTGVKPIEDFAIKNHKNSLAPLIPAVVSLLP